MSIIALALAVALAIQTVPAPAHGQHPASTPGAMSAPDNAGVDPGVAEDMVFIAATLDRMHEAASRADGAVYFDQYTPEARFIGTDASERWTMAEFRAYAEPHFARGRGWIYHPRDRVIQVSGDFAWFDEILDHDSYGVLRGSGLLRRGDSGWKIEHYVLSFAVPNAVADEVVALIRRRAAEAALAASVAAGPAH